jgi:hypothetical protein
MSYNQRHCLARPHSPSLPDWFLQASVTAQYAELIPQLASMARSLVRDLDPQNDLQFLRIRSQMHEIMGALPASPSSALCHGTSTLVQGLNVVSWRGTRAMCSLHARCNQPCASSSNLI